MTIRLMLKYDQLLKTVEELHGLDVGPLVSYSEKPIIASERVSCIC